jgi:hypothetical protein
LAFISKDPQLIYTGRNIHATMNNSRIVAIVAAAIIMVAGITTTTTAALAREDGDPQRNDFGEGASGLGSAMGTHSREGGVAGTAPYTTDPITNEPDDPGRIGIGNLGHPADVANLLGCSDALPDC